MGLIHRQKLIHITSIRSNNNFYTVKLRFWYKLTNDSVERQRLRDQSDPFGPEIKYVIKMFRFNPSAARELMQDVFGNTPSLRNVYAHGKPFHLKFLVSLNFYGQVIWILSKINGWEPVVFSNRNRRWAAACIW